MRQSWILNFLNFLQLVQMQEESSFRFEGIFGKGKWGLGGGVLIDTTPIDPTPKARVAVAPLQDSIICLWLLLARFRATAYS
jgi:hypothetical protein